MPTKAMKTAMTHSNEKVPTNGSTMAATQHTSDMTPLSTSQPERFFEPPAML